LNAAGFYAGLTPAVVGITPYIGLNFAIYETMKSLFEPIALTGPPTSKDKAASANEILKSSAQGRKSHTPGSILANLVKNGLCGAVAGGTSKFLVYPLVSWSANTA
jgi:hypothetical protein